MHIHILGICGTFMGGIALLAREMGITVSGSDANVYPPMSSQLADAGVQVQEGFEPGHLQPAPDVVVIGNVMSRGNPAVEYVLQQGLPYVSGPQWLSAHVLKDRHVIAVAGTHGKTTCSSMVAWILECTDSSPGFLIGGVPVNFGHSARLGQRKAFVVEADEYDTAFFDKRSKFVHYQPRTLVLNNLEFDHADIFPDLAAIQKQFHHLLRIVPGNGLIIHNAMDANVQDTIAMGCWTPCQGFALQSTDKHADWQALDVSPDGTQFSVSLNGVQQGVVTWNQIGQHNVANGLAAIAAATHAGAPSPEAIEALTEFKGIKRRMELRGEVGGISIYDDFAHHPTAIATTLEGLRQQIGTKRILAILEPRSNTMRMGVHNDELAKALRCADAVWMYQPADLSWDLQAVVQQIGAPAHTHDTVSAIIDEVARTASSGDHIVIMSNGGFDGIHERLMERLKER